MGQAIEGCVDRGRAIMIAGTGSLDAEPRLIEAHRAAGRLHRLENIAAQQALPYISVEG